MNAGKMNSLNETMVEETDDQLVAALKQNDKAAWGRFLARFDPLIRSVTAWSKWHFTDPVQQDLQQNIRLELTKCLQHYKGESSLDYFVKRVCIHRCIDEVRRQIRERQVMIPALREDSAECEFKLEAVVGVGDSFDPVLAVVVAERAQSLRKILDSFDDTCRTAISYFYFQELSYKEMAAKLGVSIITVGTRLAKCLMKLRKLLSRDSYFGEENPDSFDSL